MQDLSGFKRGLNLASLLATVTVAMYLTASFIAFDFAWAASATVRERAAFVVAWLGALVVVLLAWYYPEPSSTPRPRPPTGSGGQM